MDRFLLCENHMKPAEDRPVYILQTIEHKMLLQIIPFEDENELDYSFSDIFDLFSYNNSDGFTERYMLKVVDMYEMSYDEVDNYMPEIRLHIKKAWKWYKAYMKWQDEQIDMEGDADNFRLN